MPTIPELLTWFSTTIAIISAIVSVTLAVRKSRHDENKIDADAVKASAEANEKMAQSLQMYAEEIKSLKTNSKAEIEKLRSEHIEEIARLQTRLDDVQRKQASTAATLRALSAYIDTLLDGINRLTGQIHSVGLEPIWKPPKPPLTKEEKDAV